MVTPNPKSPNHDRLPFEPKKRVKKGDKPSSSTANVGQTAKVGESGQKPLEKPGKAPSAPSKATTPVKAAVPPKKSQATKRSSRPTLEQTRIPDGVSRRMIRRIILFSGLPTALGISTFVVSYLVVSNELIELPNVAVLFTSLGFFGLGVLGLSYGVLSASWEETQEGSLLGWGEFQVNLQRFISAWKDFRNKD